MPEKPSIIRCPKCGNEPKTISGTCEKCNSPLEKKCGSCGFSNSVEKNFCDQCGLMLVLQTQRLPAQEAAAPQEAPAPKPSFKLELQDIQDAVTERDSSFRQKTPPDWKTAEQKPGRNDAPAPAQSPAAPQPAAAQPAPQAAGQPAKPVRQFPTDKTPPPGQRSPYKAPAGGKAAPAGIRKFTAPILTVITLAGLLAVIYFMAVAPFLPRLRLTMTAKAYLTALSQHNYTKSYDLLSNNSKTACPLEDYVVYNKGYYAKAPAWEFRNVQVFTISAGAAMVKYQLKEAGGDWKDDYISFVRENNRWARPYIWTLFQPIDEAMARQDFIQALFLSQQLYLTDPMDPRSSGYLCAAEFFSGLYDKSADSCSRTLELSKSYPVGYSTQDLYWFEMYYADSLRYLRRNRAAIDEYEKMMKLPDLTPEQQCPLYLNRGDVYVDMREYDKTMADIQRATEICKQSPSKEDAANRLRYMTGTAMEDAIDFAKRSRLQPGQPPVVALRKQQLDALAAKLGRKGARYLPLDQWTAVYISGPEYRVFLKQTALDPAAKKAVTSDVFVFLVNLWTKNGKIEKAPEIPAQTSQPSTLPRK